jgi:diguanylate cyclase (GGDEF)-like protein
MMAGPFLLHPWMLPGAVGTALALAVLRTAWRRRGSPGGIGLGLLALSTGWWCGLQVLIFGAPSLEMKVLLSRVQYAGIAMTPAAWFFFSLDYAGIRRHLPRPVSLAILLPCVLTVALAATNGTFHRWLWRDVALLDPSRPPGFRFEHGVWFDLVRWYSYGLIAVATAVLLWYLAQRPGSGRRLSVILLAPVPALLGNVVYVLPGATRTWIDLTPAGLAAGAALIAWGLFRAGLLDLAPVARTSLVEVLHDGIVVVDGRMRVTDANPVGQALLRCVHGQPLPQPYRDWVSLDGKRVIAVRGGDPAADERYVEWSAQPLGPEAGTAIVLRDVTQRHHLEQKLRATADALAAANERLETLAATDALSGLANRRAFDSVLAMEAERARRYRRPLSLVLVDLDDFKGVNDTYGHAAGDAVLRAVGRIIAGLIRETDHAARVGGEEFGMLLPETSHDGAIEFAERVRRALAQESFPLGAAGSPALHVTASAGTASTPVEDGYDPAALFAAADGALYEAKRTGRDRVIAHPRNVWLEEAPSADAAGAGFGPAEPGRRSDQVA